jgi:bifunctional DNA-binding transcriptional regulator/antitoxin component of YhaV-PrlF toxin-antitoxin module
MSRKSTKYPVPGATDHYPADSGFAERGQPELTGAPAPPAAAYAEKRASTLSAPVAPEGERHLLKLGPDGRVLIPSELRKAMRLRDGDTLVATLGADGALQLWGTDVGLAKLRALVQPYMPQGSAVDAFLRDRREMWGDEEAGSEAPRS